MQDVLEVCGGRFHEAILMSVRLESLHWQVWRLASRGESAMAVVAVVAAVDRVGRHGEVARRGPRR